MAPPPESRMAREPPAPGPRAALPRASVCMRKASPSAPPPPSAAVKDMEKERVRSSAVLLQAMPAWFATLALSCREVEVGEVAAPSFVHCVKSWGRGVGVGDFVAGVGVLVGETLGEEPAVGEGEMGQVMLMRVAEPAAPAPSALPAPTYVTAPAVTPRPVLM